MKKRIIQLFIPMFIATLGLSYLQAQVSSSDPSSAAAKFASRGIQSTQNSDGTSTVIVNLPARPAGALLQTGGPLGSAGVVTESRPATTYTINQRNGIRSGCNVLLVHGDFDSPGNSPIQTLLQAYGDLGAVDLYDARFSTPTLAQLQAYGVVITWSNSYAYYDNVAIGNVMADYVDAGGKVIIMMFSMGDQNIHMLGRFMVEGYTAMDGNVYYGSSCLGSYNAAHPIMNGVTNVCDFYRLSSTFLTPNSSAIAYWNDGSIFIAAKDNQTVVSIAGYVGSINNSWTGQMPDVVHNSILWLCEVQPVSVIPVANWALFLSIGLILVFAMVRFRKIL